MKLAVIGSRGTIIKNLHEYVPDDIEITGVVSGGAEGIDTCAVEYADDLGIELIEFLPEYMVTSDRQAAIFRNMQIVEYSDYLLAIWDGESPGTKFCIGHAERNGKRYKIVNKQKYTDF